MNHQTVSSFNPLSIPIEGTNLIEASAGTGKTYGIAALFTRLVLLEKMPVDQILVVTFTKAATAELKTRLRKRLDEALRWLAAADGQQPETDGFLQNLLNQALQQEARERLILRLKAAVSEFDNAAIYTIHGFCQRILRDYAFLCQVPFDMELEEHGGDRLLVPAQDFWRERVVYDAELSRLVFKYRQTPESFLQEMRAFVGRPLLKGRRERTGLAEYRKKLEASWQTVCSRLPELEQKFWEIYPKLSGSSYRHDTFKTVFSELKVAAEPQCLSEKNLEKLEKFGIGQLTKGLKKNQEADPAVLADLQLLANIKRDWDALAEAEKIMLAELQLEFLDYLRTAVAEQKKTRRERSFDDLLLDVYSALTESPQRQLLAETVAESWQVALIDEFQDTDPLQYEIFRRTFMQHGNPVFLVGDPKQAIYSFRGADIYAYLQAAKDAQHHYTLDKNFRSHKKLVNSIGWFFKQKNKPFVLNGIDYGDVAAARENACLKPEEPALRVRWLNGEDEADAGKETLRKRSAEYCADEIADALNRAERGGLQYDSKPLQAGDIAVLVRTRGEGSMVGDALKARGIQSVLLRRDSVFAAQEAVALAALLAFWLQPRQTEYLRFVLGSILFQYNAEQLYALNRDEQLLLDYISAANEAQETWRRQGIYAAAQRFSARYGLETGLLARRNERSLTNYHQLLELLAEEDEQSRSPESLLNWLRGQIETASDDDDKTLRLESDEDLVKIVTMHASKGLQYALVFCPFVWDSPENRQSDGWQTLHRPCGGSELLSENQLGEEDKQQLADEELGERLRLLYVAMTRAEEQLTVYAAYCGGSRNNTFAYLLEGGSDAVRAETVAAYAAEKDEAKQMNMLLNNWQRLVDSAPEDTDIVLLKGAPASAAVQSRHGGTGQYRAAEVPHRAFEYIRYTSFTGLTRDLPVRHTQEGDELQPAIDSAEAAAEPQGLSEYAGKEDWNIHQFPRGTNTGVCLHELLEKLDFARPVSEQAEFVQEVLARYGFDEAWLPAVCQMLDAAARTALLGNAALSDLPAQNRLPEMGFMLHVEDFGTEKLKSWLAQPQLGLPAECLAAADGLDFETVKGFLNGFIDMTCIDEAGSVCIIDYKSNRLGDGAGAYTQQAMNEAMAAHHYYLQAVLYAVAVGRYLASRNIRPQALHIRYLFLRGLDGQGNGVWRWQINWPDLQQWL